MTARWCAVCFNHPALDGQIRCATCDAARNPTTAPTKRAAPKPPDLDAALASGQPLDPSLLEGLP